MGDFKAVSALDLPARFGDTKTKEDTKHYQKEWGADLKTIFLAKDGAFWASVN